MSIVQVNSSPSSNEYPVNAEKLTSIIETCLSDSSLGPETHTNLILTELSKSSSVHKFVVSVTRVDSSKGSHFDLGIESHIGGYWNKTKDGVVSHTVEPSPGIHYLVTVIWVSK
ncbi:LANO_0B06656g1_1 [Lachancea nothofagi CBS 11611]|uniref:Topoisomerase I damage affected protein 2 n=1 Tax=Lachancea nothofagi CBS 11611 TaxID=1266666 RepID=A0A1G4IZC0_9SACH|nr:LANO_0B06656g1_1 [Lachancea nothofagi CBS 11611]